MHGCAGAPELPAFEIDFAVVKAEDHSTGQGLGTGTSASKGKFSIPSRGLRALRQHTSYQARPTHKLLFPQSVSPPQPACFDCRSQEVPVNRRDGVRNTALSGRMPLRGCRYATSSGPLNSTQRSPVIPAGFSALPESSPMPWKAMFDSWFAALRWLARQNLCGLTPES
jgi:hypothetical protein